MKTASAPFDAHAEAIAERQYFQPTDKNVGDMFHRVAHWVASPETEDQERWANAFYELMINKRFCPGGRVLAGAATGHGNVLNCFVQDASPEPLDSTDGVMHLALKLALVTKVGGGNGVNLDPIKPKRPYDGPRGQAVVTIRDDHADVKKVQDATMMDLTVGEYVQRPYRTISYAPYDQAATLEGFERITVPDNVTGIWDAGATMVRKLLAGENVVIDLSELRTEGTPVKGSGGESSGPNSFAIEVFDNFATWAHLGAAEYAGPIATLRYVFASTLRTIRQGGVRRGAGMATLSITHPDIDDFITSKDLDREQAEGDISTFNISVLVSDAFMEAAEVGRTTTSPTAEQVHAYTKLREIADHAWQTGEPGLIYVDRINEHNAMLSSYGTIVSTNPCGEISLYPGEPCDLGALNLAAYVVEHGVGVAGFDKAAFEKDVATTIRFLDNVLDVNVFALEQNREMSMKLRRLGLGVMGLADALIKMGLSYNTENGRAAVNEMITSLQQAAVKASEDLAVERGAFPAFEDSDLDTPRRNVAVLTVAPTGTTSMLMGVSSGIEPVFAPFIYRKIGSEYVSLIHPLFRDLLDEHEPHPDYEKDGAWDFDKVVEAVQENHGSVQDLDFIPDAVKTVMICAHDVAPAEHVMMQGTVQRAFDASPKAANNLSKTINLPNKASVADVFDAYSLAFREQCKGITVYRDGSRQFQVLSTKKTSDDSEPNDEATTPATPTMHASESPGTPAPFERTQRMRGFTDSVKLMDKDGHNRGFFITINTDEQGVPREVFILSGKAGDEANADSEALGRVASIALQHGVPPEAIVKTLRGINGGMYGTYQKRMVVSKADIIAVALETAGVQNPEQKAVGANECPNCGSELTVTEGCLVCNVCQTYSKCG